MLSNGEEEGHAVTEGGGTRPPSHPASRSCSAQGRQLQLLPLAQRVPSPFTPALGPHTLWDGKEGESSPVFFLFPQLSDSVQQHRSDRRWEALPRAPVSCELPASPEGPTRTRFLLPHPQEATYQVCAGWLERPPPLPHWVVQNSCCKASSNEYIRACP